VTAKRGESLLWGISASSGIAEGKAYVLNRKKTKFAKRLLPRHLVDAEVARAKDAIERSKADLMRLKGSLAHDEIHEHVYILDAHLMILEDPMLLDSVVEIIQGQCKNAEWAFSTAFENYKRMFDSVNNEYLRERKSDFDYLLGWILSHLSGSMDEVLSDLKEKVIIVSHYLSPADTAQIDREKVIGFVTDIGGKTSHMAILARALKIPAVVGAEKATSEIAPGDTLIIDGMEGLVYINPSRETIKRYRERRARFGSLEKALLRDRDAPAETLDGRRIVLTANIEMVEEANSVLEYGAEGIGLYRTEFLCLKQGKIPTEEEHFQVYKSVLEKLAPRPVTIRTFDFGSDKSPIINHLGLEPNPALGLRSIRYCLKEVDVFKAQLRGILRASPYGKARILFPMISGPAELDRTKAIYEEVKEELRVKGEPFDPHVEIGIMIEVPSAALLTDVLAKEVDFLSIGTNDLIQYCLAIDRLNKAVAYLYEPLHPSILRLLRHVVEAGRRAGVEVGICGEVASDPKYVFVFLGLGLDHLSMVSYMIPWIKRIARMSRYQEARELVEALLQSSRCETNEAILSQWIKERFPDDFQRDVLRAAV